MAYEFYMKLEGISGESNADKHKDEIEVLGWSWGMNLQPQRQTLKFTHIVDKASPQLLNFACASKSPGLATLKAGKTFSKRGLVDYLVIKMSSTQIESVEQAGGGLGAPHEEVVISFDGMEENYTVLRADGSKGNTFHGECEPRL